MEIKVLGTGCPNCKRLEQLTYEVVGELGVDATILKITDILEITRHRILGTPGLVIDGRVVSAGRVPSKAELTTWIADAVAPPTR